MFVDIQMTHTSLGTVLVLEDEVLVSVDIEDLLNDMGAAEILACSTTEQALSMLARREVTLAILDVQIGGGDSFALADALAEADIPFLFASASGREILVDRHRSRPLLAKPFANEQLRGLIFATLGAGTGVEQSSLPCVSPA